MSYYDEWDREWKEEWIPRNSVYEKYPNNDWIPFEDDERSRDPEVQIFGQCFTYPKKTKKEFVCRHCKNIIPVGTPSVMRATHFNTGWRYDRFHNECLDFGMIVRATKEETYE